MGKDRDIAKTTVLGKMYGMGINTLMYTLKINREIAKHYIESFESMFPELNNWIIETGDCAVTDGYTTVPLINLRRSLDIDTNDYAYICRRAVNTPIQGLASWLVLLIACELDTRLNPECSVICNLVHDEIDVDCMGDTVGMLRPAMRQSINVVLDKYNAGEYPLYLDFKVEAFDSWGGC
jgi:DNA polymerase I-like protein with 3'-5' exonuclease and polymerase domains